MALKPCKECGREISTEATACPHCGKKNPTGMSAGKSAGLGCLVLIVFAILVGLFSSSDDTTKAAPKGPSPFEQAMAQVKLDYSWSRDPSGLIMMASFTIINPTAFRIKDVEITCTHSAPSGTRIDSNKRTIYEAVPAKGRKRVVDFNMGFIHAQAKATACRITDLVVG